MKLNATKLRKSRLQRTVSRLLPRKKNEIYIILDDVLDTYNIGSIFRLADAVNVKKIYLCKGSETPPNHRIKKASINTMEIVDWEYCETAVLAIENLKLKIENLQIVAVEQSDKSVPYDKFDYKLPIALVVGHESNGVSKEVLDLCDGIVELPMLGVNVSLNVMVSLGIVLYRIISDAGLD
ncbi:MAG: TrmH family RNA methyltransferase [Microgenomates group bacterium]|jgi:tRNA G18 (ribose-2'-O)-methylase SpoU